jgi:hypothetical protein
MLKKLKIMNVIHEHLDILQNIESATIAFCRENPIIKDANVLAVYEKVYSQIERQKRKMPALPVVLPPTTLQLYNAVKEICDERIEGNESEFFTEDTQVPPAIMLLCLKKLIDSVPFWTKKNGASGYINFVGSAMP